jgi:hypothetical protein
VKKTVYCLAILFLLVSCNPDGKDHEECSLDALKKYSTSAEKVTIKDRLGNKIIYPYEQTKSGVFIEGDIKVGEGKLTPKSLIRVGKTWTDGIVYYTIDSSIDDNDVDDIEDAIEHWQDKTGGEIVFKKRVSESNYVEFIKDDGCWSQVGMMGGKQNISLDDGCGLPQAIHEIGHALGLWHEQGRADRDEYVEILWCNITEDKRYNFLQVGSKGSDSGSYDYDSIMHYTKYAFSNNAQATLKSITSTSLPLFHPNKLSKGDTEGIACLYGYGTCDYE